MEQLKMESSPSPSSSTTPSSSSQASASNSMASASSLAALVKVEGGSSVGGGPGGTGSGGRASEDGEGMNVAHSESTPEQEQDDGQLGEGEGQASSSTTTGTDVEGGSSSGNGAWEANGRIHPLMDQVILGHLFKFMPPGSLATSRLVCRTWHDLSFSTWRSNATVKICSLLRGPSDKHNYYLKDEERTSLGQFMDFWEANCLIKAYRQFHLDRWRFQGGGAAADVTRFWQGVGSQITKLTMDNCNTAKLEHFMKVIIKYCPNLDTLILKDFTVGGTFWMWDNNEFHVEDEDDRPPNPNPVHGEHSHLKSLQLIYSPDRGYGYFTSLRVHYIELLAHFPHVMSIKVSANQHRMDLEVLELLRAVKEVRAQDTQKLPISELVTDGAWEFFPEPQQNDEQRLRRRHPPLSPTPRVMIMRLLLELRIPLPSISLTGNLSQIEIQNIIEISAGILTELIVYTHSSPGHNFPFGLHLDNLRHLTMPEGFCRTLELLKYTPNLETLGINDNDISFATILGRPRGMVTDLISNTFKPDLEDVKLLKLSSLTIQSVVRDYDLKWLVRLMPHVQRLCMFLDDRQFAIVCETWRELRNLSVLGNSLTDGGVTGMMEVRGSGTEKKMVVVHPNVTYLEKLVVFSAPMSTLTSASMYHGFLKLEPLRQIGFQKAEEMEVAAKEALLRKNVQLQPSRY